MALLVQRALQVVQQSEVTFEEVDDLDELNKVLLTSPVRQQPQTEQPRDHSFDQHDDTSMAVITRRQCDNGTSARVALDCWTRIITESRIHFRSFMKENEPDSDLFTSRYLIDVTSRPTPTVAKRSDVVLDRRTMTYTFDGTVITRPPYSYTAHIIAAFYTSGKKELKLSEIRENVRSLFPETYTYHPEEWSKTWNNSVQRTMSKKKFFQWRAGLYSLRLDNIDESLMTKLILPDREDLYQYSYYLHDHLGVPDMITSLKAEDNKSLAPPSTTTLVSRPEATVCKRAYDDDACYVAKKPRLYMPQRPHFHRNEVTTQTDVKHLWCEWEPSVRDVHSATRR